MDFCKSTMATVTDTERREHSESRQGPRECDTGPINVTARARERETARERERERERERIKPEERKKDRRSIGQMTSLLAFNGSDFFSLYVCVCVCVSGPTATSLKAT